MSSKLIVLRTFCLSILISVLAIGTIQAQEQINESMPFQNDPDKDYSIFIPSAYLLGEPVPAFVALHPFNTNRWNGQTWCEELADFAEMNGVILICPDGGADGKIDDPIDTAFTSFLLDSAFIWYDIDETQVYAIGFSWGGKTTYTYGLNHIDKFAGLLPIGAAITIGEINGISENAMDVPVYIVHGSQDNPNVRFHPLLEAMESNGACVESNLLQGVGHTIDFDNQVEILTEAYDFLKDNACTTTSLEGSEKVSKKKILPYSMIAQNQIVNLRLDQSASWEVISINGELVKAGREHRMVADMTRGIYIIRVGKHTEVFSVF